MYHLLLIFLLFFSFLTTILSSPIVVLHGIASSAEKMNAFSNWLVQEFNTDVYNLEIGNGEKTSLYTPMLIQLEELCANIYEIEKLKTGFHFIGMSQGGLLARGYVERCNLYPVINLITMVSPHGGAFKMDTTKINMYAPFMQDHFSLAGYWRDPLRREEYLNKCTYLPILNNEKIIKETNISLLQKNNLKKIDNFILIWSPKDDVLIPPESGKFSFYDETYKIIPLEDTRIYKEDTLGLKYLNENKKLHFHETNCTHVDHRDPICYRQIYEILKIYL
jgi:palmitoyl-protein thioesterase